MRSPSSAIVPWQVTITLGFASHNISSYKNKQLQPQYIAKTQHQVSPGTHVAVPALMGLEEPPTAHGVPLSSMAKSSPLSALVRFQESLHRGNSSSAGFFIKDLQKPPQAWVHHFKEGIFVSFTAQSRICIFRITAHITCSCNCLYPLLWVLLTPGKLLLQLQLPL